MYAFARGFMIAAAMFCCAMLGSLAQSYETIGHGLNPWVCVATGLVLCAAVVSFCNLRD